jgi:hypothetical protein
MTSSDLIDTRPTPEGTTTAGVTDPSTTGADDLPADLGETGPEKRVALPKPDVNNITVLTENLPNEPILPWHHFDSPWLDKDSTTDEIPPEAPPAPVPEAAGEQLSLALDIASAPEDTPSSPKAAPPTDKIET